MVKFASKKRIGIFGGSFSPIHHGHLLMAEIARVKMKLDYVIFMPVFHSPYKSRSPISQDKHRLNMIKLAIANNTYFKVSDMELKRKGVSYSIDTLREVQNINPTSKLFWIIGDDHIEKLPKWKNFDEIIKIASFVAISRLWFNVSSTEVRQLIRTKQSIRYLTTDKVIDYIKKHQLYRKQ